MKIRKWIVILIIIALFSLILAILFRGIKNNTNIDDLIEKKQTTVNKNIEDNSDKGEDNAIEDKEDKIEENETNNEGNNDLSNGKKDEIDNKESKDNTKKDENNMVHFSANIEKKLGYIVSVNKDQIVFDEINILPNSECEGMEICFVNNSKILNKIAVSKNLEIDSYFVNYLTNGNLKQSKKIGLNSFIEFFESDDSKDYTWFDKIPYWISLQNGEVTKIEEQQIKSQYMLNDDFYENKDL